VLTKMLLLFAAGIPPAGLSACGGIVSIDAESRGQAGSTGGGDDPTIGCDPGRADCNGAAADGCEADLESDEAHCGSCGHGCQSGHCQSGLCQQVIVASVGQGSAYRIAATETHVYWKGEDGSVVRSADDGTAPEIIATEQDGPGDITVDGTSVYWANPDLGTIMRAPLAGGAPSVVASGEVQPWSLAVSGTTLVWTDHGAETVRSTSLVSGGVVTIATAPSAWSVAVDSGSVYWTTSFASGVYGAPLSGGASITLVTGFSSPSDLALQSGTVYFVTDSDAGLYSVPVAGGEMTTLASSGGSGLAVDEDNVYFGQHDGRIVRMPRAGGAETVIGIGPWAATDIALTSKSVYWSAQGVILKVAK